MASIYRRVWKWVVITRRHRRGLARRFVPQDWFAKILVLGNGGRVPVRRIVVAIPLYSNVTGIVPILESLLVKGLPIGTTMAFCMSAVAASIPENDDAAPNYDHQTASGLLYVTLWVIFTLVGWLFNSLGSHIQ